MCQMLRSFYTTGARYHQILVILKKKSLRYFRDNRVVSFVVTFSRQEELKYELWIVNLTPLLMFNLVQAIMCPSLRSLIPIQRKISTFITEFIFRTRKITFSCKADVNILEVSSFLCLCLCTTLRLLSAF